jgi:hypothetical protein
MNTTNKLKPVPKIGSSYHFFDDGKIRESRHYIATVSDVITPEQTKNIMFSRADDEISFEISLYEIWRNEINDHRQDTNFKVIAAGASMEVGAPWLYAEETDYFIKCSIPEYDENDVWFVRTVNGGWFSLDTNSWWMSGELDVDGRLFNNMMKDYETTTV